MGHQSYVLLCTETALSNHPAVIPKSSCDVHLLRIPCIILFWLNLGNCWKKIRKLRPGWDFNLQPSNQNKTALQQDHEASLLKCGQMSPSNWAKIQWHTALHYYQSNKLYETLVTISFFVILTFIFYYQHPTSRMNMIMSRRNFVCIWICNWHLR